MGSFRAIKIILILPHHDLLSVRFHRPFLFKDGYNKIYWSSKDGGHSSFR